MSKLEQKLRADPRVEDLSHDDDGWWLYLSHGLHTDQGQGSHLISDTSLTRVARELRGISAKTHRCTCDECEKNFKR